MNYYYLLFAATPVLGYILSTWLNERPNGLLKNESLSNVVSEKPSWHLPLVIIGMIMSFAYNLIIYSVYFIVYLLKHVGFILHWIYSHIIKPIYEVAVKIILMVIDILMLLLRVSIKYIITIPIDIFLSVINSVPKVFNWSNYYRTLKVLMIGFVLYALLIFIGYLIDQPMVGQIGGPFVLVISITWIVGLVSFDSHASGRRAALFAMTVIGVILLLALFVFGSNQLDASTVWGGVFAGLFHSPSVVSIMAILVLTIAVAFITNVGAIYVNTKGIESGFKSRLKHVVFDSFNRSWYFLVQPLFVGLIGVLISIVPYYVMNFSADSLQNKVVEPALIAKNEALNKELSLNKMIDKRENLINNDTLTSRELDLFLDTVKTEYKLLQQAIENKRYNDYFSGTVPLRKIPSEIITKKEFSKMITDAKKEIANSKKEKSEGLTELDKRIKEADSYQVENVPKYKADKERFEKVSTTFISSMEGSLKANESADFQYKATYLLFLLAKGLLYSILLALIVNLYAYSVMPVYQMWQGSYLISEVKEATAKNPHQPWVGLLIIGLAIGGMMFMGDIKSKMLNLFKSAPTEILNEDISAEDNNETDDPNNPEQEVVLEDQPEPVVADPEYYFCSDGTPIHLSYLMDGDCDCPETCEDENMGD
ncbi:MAG: hypothetical protein QNL60_01390 [Flavobacteriales bacterium]